MNAWKEEMKGKITYADRQMIPDLTSLWIEAFGDEKEYIEFYFANRFLEENLLVYLLDGKPVSMISMLPAYLHCQEVLSDCGKGCSSLPIRYIYAVATRKACRKRGYARALLEEAHRLLQVPLVLEPASESLSGYYRRMGFRDAFAVTERSIQTKIQEDAVLCAAELATAPNRNGLAAVGMTVSNSGNAQRYWLLTITPREYKKIRDEKLLRNGYVEWDEAAVSYAMLENEYCGGVAYKVFHDDMEDILMYRMEDGHMKILETTLSDTDIEGVLEKLRLSPATVVVRRPVTAGGSRRSFGMILGDADVRDGYLNLTLE